MELKAEGSKGDEGNTVGMAGRGEGDCVDGMRSNSDDEKGYCGSNNNVCCNSEIMTEVMK